MYMNIDKAVFAIINVFLTIIYAFGSGLWINAGSSFYRSLKKPFWQPPDFIFGLIWPYNFLILIVISISVISLGSATQKNIWLICYSTSVVAALLWSKLFYSSESLLPAAIFLAITASLTLVMTYLAWSLKLWAGLAILPYQIWVIVASSLSFGYAYLNKN